MNDQMADVCLILEGTYPFVRGGVSSWVHNLITGLPDVRFTLLHLGASPQARYEQKYELPPNVEGLAQLYLQGHAEPNPGHPAPKGRRGLESVTTWQALDAFHRQPSHDQMAREFQSLFSLLDGEGRGGISLREPHSSHSSWDLLTRLYEQYARDISFVDFYWTWRYTHLPLFALMRAPLPRARVYHSLSTGYAGLVGSFAALRYGAPLMLTEHGIYTRERAIEIAQATWIYEPPREHAFVVEWTHSFFKQWWIDLFRYMSAITYQHSDRILTITRANQEAQLRDGADAGKMEVIANGIDPDLFAGLRDKRPADGGVFTVGFVGRVVRIKDVKTFIRAMKIVAGTISRLRVLVVGPTEEEPEYFEDCKQLVEMLDLSEVMTFVGQAKVTDFYPQLDVVVLTSLSEAQPLVLLEANCAGVPAVASNVGACDELLIGRTPEDRAIGPSGIVTPVASPNETAQAVIDLWQDPGLRHRMAVAGMRRVETYYREENVTARYRAIYRELGSGDERLCPAQQSPPPPLRCPMGGTAWQASASS
jgi:glycosyltransferase involved in cell wall biosynthesis